VLQPLASSYAVLSEDEKDLGVCLVDIGGGTTDLAVWTQGAIRHTSVTPIAGDQITNDIAMALRTPTREAEDIKCKYGCALSQLADPAETLEVAGVDERPSRKMSRRALADVIQPRVEELYELIQNELRRAGFEEVLSSGLVITGGAAVMPGMIELGEEIFHMPVRLGLPKYNGSLADVVQNPRFSTSYGLLLEAQTQRKRGQKVSETRSMKDVLSRMKSWLTKNF
jgi:cell division protein FtsA